MLDYIVTLLSGQQMNGLDYGAVGGFMVYRLLQRSINRILIRQFLPVPGLICS